LGKSTGNDDQSLKKDLLPLEDDEAQLDSYLNRISRFKKCSQLLALIVVLLGILSALGWFFNIPLLRGEYMGIPGSKLNTAFLFILAGSCLYLLNHKLNPRQLMISRAISIIIVILSVLTLIEYIVGLDLGINQLFAGVLPSNVGVLSKSRFLSAVNFVFLGLALLMASYKYKIRWVQIFAFTCGFVALLGLSSYLYGRNVTHSFDLLVQMAFLSSLIHICLSIGILFLFPDRSYMGRITAQHTGGFMARRLLPTALGAVFLLGLLISVGDRLHIYSDQFDDLFSIIVTMIVLATIIGWNAKMLNKMDRQRQESNQERLNLKIFYENLVEGINEGIWVADSQDRLYYMNRGMEEICGVKTEKMKGFHILKDLPDETTGQLKEYYLTAKESLKPVYYDSISVTSPTGRESYQSGWIIPQLKEGNFNGAICTVVDQTKRKEAEKALSRSETYYKTIFENTGTATIIVGVDGLITMANKKCESLSGYNVDELENKLKWMDFVHSADLEMMENIHRIRRHPEREVPSEYEFRLLNKHGTEKQILLSASLIPGTTDSVVSLLDITERKNAEIEIKQSLSEKELLLREIHHRVKNNMQIISSLLNLQRSYIEDEDADNLLQESQGRVKSMALVHEKLYQTADLARINVEEYLRNLTMNLFHSYSVKSGISLQMDVGKIFFDIDTAVPLGLIINELVSNSLKYAFPHQEKGVMSISLHEKPDNRGAGEYVLRVRDDGVGFPEDLDFHNTPSLGLQLVNNLVHQLDGSIELVRGDGTCFHINFREQRYKDRV